MHKELINKAKELFDTPEKWNTFLELVWQKNDIRNEWYNKLKEEANKYFSTIDVVDKWAFNSWGIWDMHWYLTQYGDKSISLLLGWWGDLTLHTNGDFYDLEKINKLVKTKHFSPILSAFNRIDEINQGNRIAYEVKNYIFNSPYDSKFDVDRLAWYAGNNTENFIKQISEKVNRFRKNERVTELLEELNEITKK